MYIVFISLALGLLFGCLYKNTTISRLFNLFTEILLLLLVGLMGLNLGSNREIISNFSDLWIKALIFSLAASLGSIGLVSLLLKVLDRKK